MRIPKKAIENLIEKIPDHWFPETLDKFIYDSDLAMSEVCSKCKNFGEADTCLTCGVRLFLLLKIWQEGAPLIANKFHFDEYQNGLYEDKPIRINDRSESGNRKLALKKRR